MDHFRFLFSPSAHVLGQTILYSLFQSFIIFLCTWIILKLIPAASSKIKYAICYSAYMVITASFIITLVYKIYALPNLGRANTMMKQSLHESILWEPSSSTLFSFSYLDKYLPFLVACYLSGIVWLAFRLAYNYMQTNILKKNGLSGLPEDLQLCFEQLVKKINITHTPGIYFSSKIISPVMIGFLKPVILIPFAIINHLSVQQFEAILLHELTHIRRKDFLWNLIQSVADTILFFNPFAAWISKTIREEREKCCDEMVLQWSDPYHYAQALLALQEPVQKQVLLLKSIGNHTQLLHRIKNIFEMKKNHLNFSQKFMAFLLVMIATFSLAWLTPKDIKPSISKNENNALAYLFQGYVSPFLYLRSLHDSNPPALAPLNRKLSNSYKNDISMKTAPLPPLPPVPPIAALPAAPAQPPMPPMPPLPPSPPLPPLNLKDSVPGANGYFNSKEWKDQQEAFSKNTEAITKYLESKEWKDQQKTIKRNSVAMQKYFSSPEWKKQQKEIQKNAQQLQEYFNSPEWSKNKKEIQKSANAIKEYLNSPEWKKQQQEIQKSTQHFQEYFNSPGWKKQQELIQHSTDSVVAYFNGKNWRQQQESINKAMEKTKKYFDSDQWKKQQENLNKMMEEQKEEMKKLPTQN
ncbi:MAG: M56 family metallopeptidase [Ginsengibacter sp.]